MSDSCFICTTIGYTCIGKKGKTMGKTGKTSLGKAPKKQSDSPIQAKLSVASSVWVSDT